MSTLPHTPMSGKDALRLISTFMESVAASGGATGTFTEEELEEVQALMYERSAAIKARLGEVTDKEFIDLFAALKIAEEVMDSMRYILRYIGGIERLSSCVRVAKDMGAL